MVEGTTFFDGMPAEAPREKACEDELTRVVTEYMPLVRHVVNRLVGGSAQAGLLQYEDMISCGVQGLIEAHRSYDGSRGAKFSTFAVPRIRGSVLDALRAANPLPRSLQKLAGDIDRGLTCLYAELGRTPSRQELATHLGLALDDFLEASRATSIRVLSLESLAEMSSGAAEKLAEMADDDPGIDPDTVTEKADLIQALLRALQALPVREREIIRLYYMESRSLKSIGQDLAISESRASQLRHRAIRRLRTALEGGESAAA